MLFIFINKLKYVELFFAKQIIPLLFAKTFQMSLSLHSLIIPLRPFRLLG